MRTIKVIVIFSTLIFSTCKKENIETIETFQLKNLKKFEVLVYTKNGIVTEHNFTPDNIYNWNFFQNHIIQKIQIKNSENAAFFYPPSEFCESLETIHGNLNVHYILDSIFFEGNVAFNNHTYPTDIRGTLLNDTVKIKAVCFVYKYSNNTGSEGGIGFYPYTLQQILDLYWVDETESSPSDTLAIYPMELNLVKQKND